MIKKKKLYLKKIILNYKKCKVRGGLGRWHTVSCKNLPYLCNNCKYKKKLKKYFIT